MAISYIRASGKDIAELVESIDKAVDGHPSSHVSIACIVVAVMAQKPNITKEVLQDAVKGVSDWLSLHLESVSPTIN